MSTRQAEAERMPVARAFRSALALALLLTLSACAATAPVPPSGTKHIRPPVVAKDIDSAEVADDTIAPPDAGPNTEPDNVFESVGGIVDRAQRGASEQFNAFVHEIDDFFAGDQASDEPNSSFIRLRADAVKPALDSFEVDPTVRLRLVLPNLEKRFRLLLSTEDDLSDSSDELERVSDDNADENVSLALRFVQSARDNIDVGFDIGARRRDDQFQAFGRVSAEYRRTLTEHWQLRLRNRYFYFWRSGFDNRFRLDFTRDLADVDAFDGSFFRASSTVNARATRSGARLGQSLGVYFDLGAQSALAIEGLATYDTELNDDINQRFRGGEFRLRYRRKLWRPWLFVEFWPAVAWPAERDFRRTWNGLIRVEAIIGGAEINTN